MTQSFDEWFEKNGELYREPTSDERYLFEAGAQSRQAEVDELKKNFNNSLKTIEIQQRFLDDEDGANKLLTGRVDELQKRIDEALKMLSDWDDQTYRDDSYQLIGEIEDTLKGNQDEK